MRKAIAESFGVRQTENLEQVESALASLFLAHQAMLDSRLDNLVAELVGGVECGSCRLRDIADAGAAQLADATLPQLQDVGAVKFHFAAGDFGAAAAVAERREPDR